ncbi:hypothetical protein WJ0W_007182 [Paenibacillus melissococcoides]|uniref:Uncharacterized protein n=1 Tax=Paenibacillus melissococcoides TaxID=2912268 RepID=A0ABN8UBL0_9BACL|nr:MULTISPECIES: hypothetical protein [Paenibacillus]GIO81877.1 hypothetical protein J6TS7_54870 [Paenibacillus dendritiformis]CAH8248514.1 hypothetical protein WJ0W_007182 [Paenibacillus melissococcoides]CAH8722000.1 hypothetical protein HTL2_006643 [Paenibacillus melissococcoides]CAH8722060.1 hypothetical protein WDD9_006601 [Paenibacillus melissococcoides]
MTKKTDALRTVYRIATLQEPADEAIELLASVPFERALDVLLLVRQYGKPIRTPVNFIRRALDEGWTPETAPRPTNRRLENIEKNLYMRRGFTETEAVAQMKSDRERYSWT